MNRRIILSICLTAGVLTGATMLSAQDKPASNVTSMRSVVEGSRWDLWRCNIQSPVGKEDSAGLAQAIQRLKSVRFQKKSDLFAKAEDSSSEPSSHSTSQLDTTTTHPGRIDPEILTKLKQLSPSSIMDPAALADTLFVGGYLESAVFFYEMAMENETDAEEAWLLFQTANCYREISPSAAVKAYGKLLAEHPDSLWSSAANMSMHIIEWRKANNLDDLLGELRMRTRQKTLPIARNNNE